MSSCSPAQPSAASDPRPCICRSLERPIVHRYKEIEEFPQALNNSQMWNWSSRLFLTDARLNMTQELEAGLPTKYTKEELDEFEKVLKEHESWLDEWVEKQKKVKMNEDPVILSSEMRARAKVLENHLQKLYRKRTPKPATTKKSSASASSGTASTSTSAGTSEATSESDTASAGSSSSTGAASSQDPHRHEEL